MIGGIGLLCLSGCLDAPTCTEIGCSSTQTCDVTSGLCVTLSQDCREDPTICPSGQVCSPIIGRCISPQQQCGRDQIECPRGQLCDAEAGLCRTLGPCRSDPDCPTE